MKNNVMVLFATVVAIAAMFAISDSNGITGFFIATDTIQPDSGGKDAHMISGSPNYNYGADTGMDIRADGSRRALIEFNLSNASSYTGIISATLKLYVTAKGSADPVVYIHRVTNPWVEGSGTGSKTDDGVTWNNRSGTQIWTSSGGDYDQNVYANTTVTGTNAWFSWDVTGLVRDWANGTYSNYGLLLRTNTTSSATTTFSTSDNTNSSRRPILEIRYAIPLNIGFESPTPDSGSTVNRTWVYVNVTLSNGTATNAKLEFNGANYTMTNASATPSNMWYYNMTNMTDGNYSYKVYANESDMKIFYESSSRTVSVSIFSADSAPPQWNNMQNSVPGTYSETPSAFNVTWTDSAGISAALFESNHSGTAVNYTMSDLGSNVRGFSAVIPAGTFYWKSYANDTDGNFNSTPAYAFTIGKASPSLALLLDGQQANLTVNSGSTVNITASLTAPSGGSLSLNMDGTAIASGPSPLQNLSLFANAGTFIINASYAGNQNYTASSSNLHVTVNTVPKEVTGITLYFNGGSSTSFETGTSLNITAELNASGKTIYMFTNFTGYTQSGTTPLTNISTYGTAGIYNITAWFPGDSGSEAATATAIITISTTPPAQPPGPSTESSDTGSTTVKNNSANRTLVCPTCPFSTDWSACSNGLQMRIVYECGKTTDYICLSRAEERACEMPQQPAPNGTAQHEETAPLASVTGLVGMMPGLVQMAGLAATMGGVVIVWRYMRGAKTSHKRQSPVIKQRKEKSKLPEKTTGKK